MLPTEYAKRRQLNDEVHARPPEALAPPLDLIYLALLTNADRRDADWEHARALFKEGGIELPDFALNHVSRSLGATRVVHERHSEFIRYTFITREGAGSTFDNTVLPGVPPAWLSGLGGELIAATRVKVRRGADMPVRDNEAIAAEFFSGNTIIGARLAGGVAQAYTDLRIHPDGFGRMLVIDDGMQPRQAGRMIQRLLEFDTYRMMALLALPVARGLWPAIEASERDLAELAGGIATEGASNEKELLERLTRLEADVQRRSADHHYRFSASAAYHELVRQRIAELREERIEGLQTFREFTERRLEPAMNTCRAAAINLNTLSQRIAQTTQLLSTRVEIVRERQNRALLEAMSRRAEQQLRLQQTVEGLSVVAISYYVVGLIGYAAKAMKAGGYAVNPDIVVGVSVPIVVGAIAFGLRRLAHMIGLGRPPATPPPVTPSAERDGH